MPTSVSTSINYEASAKLTVKEKKPGETKSAKITLKHPNPTTDTQTKGALTGKLTYSPTLGYQFEWKINKPAGTTTTRTFTVSYTETETEGSGGQVSLKITKIVEVGGNYQWNASDQTANTKTATIAVTYAPPAITMDDTTSANFAYEVESRSAEYKKTGNGEWVPKEAGKTIQNATWGAADPDSYSTTTP